MNLIEIISPDINAPRSINLERDRNNMSIITDYKLTSKTLEIFKRFTRALLGERVSAWSLTGPYGMGKSSFCNFLLSITGPKYDTRTKAARKALKSADPVLYRDFKSGSNRIADKNGFFRVNMTASYESVNHSLARGLQDELENYLGEIAIQGLIEKITALRQEIVISSQDLLSLFKETLKIQNRPMIIILDEFGKNLDYLSHHPNRGDIFILQQLAETDSVYIWVVLHQAFDEYVVGLSSTQRKEWSKVQGRFEDVSFIESTPQMLYLMYKALKKELSSSQKQRIEEWARRAISITDIPALSRKMFDLDTVQNIYPFHPITALALIELCKKFAQNDRTLLSFICSGDPQALPVLLNKLNWSDEDDNPVPAVGLDYLYDYFIGITSGTYNNRPEFQRWVEIDSIIQQAGNISIIETSILKSIGVLNLISTSLGIKANKEIIINIMEYSQNIETAVVLQAIKLLVAKGVLIYREYAGEYRLWEGSDFDVAEAVQEQKSKMMISPLGDLLQEYLPLSPLIASRHAFNSGTVRRFERRWVPNDQINNQLTPIKGYDGLIVYTFGTEAELVDIPEKCRDLRPLLIAYVANQSTLQELGMEVAAVRAVFDSSPELSHDGIARKEVKYRIKAAEQTFREYIFQIYSPGSEELQWYSEGNRADIKNNKELSAFLSDLFDRTYYRCPYIGNEMISYENLSSAVAKARRELIEAMTVKADESQFGLSGYGPEVAIYRSLLASTGLHTGDDERGWYLTLEGNDPRLNFLWTKISNIINESGENGCTIQDLFERLQSPPFGMRLGPIPIYVCLYLLVKSEEIVVFRESTYLPYLNTTEVSLLMKRPDLFILKPAIADQWESTVFSMYHELFSNRMLYEDINLRNRSMLGVVGPLIKFFNDLPNYSKNTRQISREAQMIRTAIHNSIDPKQLLMEELPKALGVAITKDLQPNHDWHEGFLEKLRAAMNELDQAYPQLNNNIQQVLLDVFAHTDIACLMNDLSCRIKDLYQLCDDTELKAVMKAIIRESNEASEWVRGIAGIVIKKPTQSWGDEDFIPFSLRIRDYADRIKQLETLAAADGLVLKDKKLVSIMEPDGSSNRVMLPIIKQPDSEISRQIRQIMSYPQESIAAIISVLLEQLDRGENNAGSKH